MIGFDTPEMLGPGLVLAAAILAILLTERRRRDAAIRLLTTVDHRSTSPILGASTTLGLLLVALCGPQWGHHEESSIQAASDVWFVVDVSRSMMAPDVSPDRLGRAKELLLSLLDTLADRRAGLIAFAGEARVVCPPTGDRAFLKSSIESLSIDSAPSGGSDLAAPFRLLAERSSDRETPAIALLVSDGGHDPARAALAAQMARHKQLIVFTLGIGNPETATPIPDDMATGFLIERGEIVQSRLEEAPLRQIAEQTGGLYLPAQTGDVDTAPIFLRRIEPRAAEIVQRSNTVPTLRYRWFVGLALLMALLSMSRTPRRLAPAHREPR